MATPTDYFVAASSGDDGTGNGSVGTPWATVQHALDTITRDTTNGDQINVKASETLTLGAAWDFSTYGSPSATAPLVIRGYTSAADDGGRATIDLDGSYTLISDSGIDGIYLIDCDFQNWSGDLLNVDNNCWVIRCTADATASGTDGFEIDGYGGIIDCYVKGCAVAYAVFGSVVYGCYAEGVTSIGISMQTGSAAINSVIHCSNTAAIGIQAFMSTVIGNSLYNSTAGTNEGINLDVYQDSLVLNNIVEGWSGVGGAGMRADTGPIPVAGHNAFYNCTTNEALTDLIFDFGNDDSLAASVFTNPGAGDFGISDNAMVKGDGFPGAFRGSSTTGYLDKGAVQREESGGGGLPVMGGAIVRD